MHRILLIEDDEPLRKMIRKVLERAGYEVQEAPNGKIGLKLYSEQPSELILTDLIMPEKEGLETIMEFRRLAAGVKIIAMSGGNRMNPKVNLAMAQKFGAARTLAKPFSHQDILEAVAEVLEKRT